MKRRYPVNGPVPNSLIVTYRLQGVSFLDEQLSTGDVDVHPERLLLLVRGIRRARVLTEKTEPDTDRDR